MEQPIDNFKIVSQTRRIPENYTTTMPARAGLMAGIAGSLSIMLVVAVLLVLSGQDIFTAARLIAATVYGSEAATGFLPVLIGTSIHLVTGGVLGTIFAAVIPRAPRNFWIMAGLIYGMGAWLVSTFVILPIIASPMVLGEANVSVLLIAHVIYGLILGAAGASYGLLWDLPKRFKSRSTAE